MDPRPRSTELPMCRITILVILLAPLSVRGADGKGGLDDVAPLIDAQTLVVARVDVHRINADAWIDLVAKFLPDTPETIDVVRNTAKAWLDTYRKRGGREVYFLFGL